MHSPSFVKISAPYVEYFANYHTYWTTLIICDLDLSPCRKITKIRKKDKAAIKVIVTQYKYIQSDVFKFAKVNILA